MSLRFLPVDGRNAESVRELSRVATAIVRDYYDPIVGEAQNTYMLVRFQSEEAIRSQLAAGYAYYLLYDRRIVGFVGFYPREEDLYLSKFYLYADCRGQGYGHEALAWLQAEARRRGLGAISLNVNKHNPTIRVYEHWGFVRVADEKKDIGGGYYMDDYVYRLPLDR